MTKKELLDEIRRRDEIIDSMRGVEADYLYFYTKFNVISTIAESAITQSEKLKMIRAVILYG